MFFTLVLIVVLAVSSASPQEPPRLDAAVPGPEAGRADGLARVDDHVITRGELEAHFAVFYVDDRVLTAMDGLPPLEREQIHRVGLARALPELVDHHLLLAAASEEYPDLEAVRKVIDEMLAVRLDELSRQNGSLMAVVESFHRRGVALQDWKDVMSDAILVQNYVRPRVKARVRVSPSDMRRFYEQERERFQRPPRVVYRVILVDPAGCETTQQERAKADSVLLLLGEGANFGELAERYSLDRDTTEGGLREVEAPSDQPGWLPPVCAGLQPGETSGVQETEAGCCIARLEQLVPGYVPPFEEVQGKVRALVTGRKTREAEGELIDKLRGRAHVEYLPAGQELLKP